MSTRERQGYTPYGPKIKLNINPLDKTYELLDGTNKIRSRNGILYTLDSIFTYNTALVQLHYRHYLHPVPDLEISPGTYTCLGVSYRPREQTWDGLGSANPIHVTGDAISTDAHWAAWCGTIVHAVHNHYTNHDTRPIFKAADTLRWALKTAQHDPALATLLENQPAIILTSSDWETLTN